MFEYFEKCFIIFLEKFEYELMIGKKKTKQMEKGGSKQCQEKQKLSWKSTLYGSAMNISVSWCIYEI